MLMRWANGSIGMSDIEDDGIVVNDTRDSSKKCYVVWIRNYIDAVSYQGMVEI